MVHGVGELTAGDGSDWSKQVSSMAPTRLQRDQTFLYEVCGLQDYTIRRYPIRHTNGKIVTPKPKPTGSAYGLVLFPSKIPCSMMLHDGIT